MRYYKVFDGSDELFKVKGSRNLQKELGELWIYTVLTDHNFTIEDCKTKKRYLFDEIYGCDIEHNLPKPSNVGCRDDCINCKNHINFIGGKDGYRDGRSGNLRF